MQGGTWRDLVTMFQRLASKKAIPRPDIPNMALVDGPQGIRLGRFNNTSFPIRPAAIPSVHAMASPWASVLVIGIGSPMGREGCILGVGIILSPGVNLDRNPVRVRNFEYDSDDPILTGRDVLPFYTLNALIQAMYDRELQGFGNTRILRPVESEDPQTKIALREVTVFDTIYDVFAQRAIHGDGSKIYCRNQVKNTHSAGVLSRPIKNNNVH